MATPITTDEPKLEEVEVKPAAEALAAAVKQEVSVVAPSAPILDLSKALSVTEVNGTQVVCF